MLRLICMKSPMKIDFNDNILGFWCALKIVDSFECVCALLFFFGSWLFISWLSMNFVALTTANIVTMASDHRITQPQQHTNRRRGRKKCFDECTSLARHCTCLYIFRVHANQPLFFGRRRFRFGVNALNAYEFRHKSNTRKTIIGISLYPKIYMP